MLWPNRVVNIGQDAQWNVNKHIVCKLPLHSVFLEIFDFDYQRKTPIHIFMYYERSNTCTRIQNFRGFSSFVRGGIK